MHTFRWYEYGSVLQDQTGGLMIGLVEYREKVHIYVDTD